MEYWRSKAFKLLAVEWDQKLAQAGFEDVEMTVGSIKQLKQRATNIYSRATDLEKEATLEYYRLMEGAVHLVKFPSETDMYIMSRHADGATILEIVEELKQRGIVLYRKVVGRTIRSYQIEWGMPVLNMRNRKLPTK